MENRKKNTIFNNWLFVYKETKVENPKLFFLMFSIGIIELVISLIGVYYPAFVVGGTQNYSKNVREYVLVLVVLTLLLIISKCIISKLNINYSVQKESGRQYFINRLNKKIMKYNYDYIENPKIQVKIEQATDILYTGNPVTGINGIYNATMGIFNMLIASLCYVSILKTLSVLVVGFIVLVTIGVMIFNSKRIKYINDNRNNWAIVDKKLNYINEKLTRSEFGKDIRNFAASKWFVDKAEKLIGERVEWKKKVANKDYNIESYKVALFAVRDLLVIVYAIYMYSKGIIDISDFVLYIGAVMQFSNYFTNGLNNCSIMKAASLEIDILRELIDVNNSEEKKIFNTDGYTCDIVFDHVYFKYSEENDYIIKDFCLHIKKGEKIALVGMNGSGKTTLIKLLCGFYSPHKGKILIDGKDISEYTKESVYNLYSAVFQDQLLLPFSIGENIALNGKEHYDVKKIENCMRNSGLINKFADYNIMLIKAANEDGIELSGGEIQKLLLARALYKNAPILLLDEPTAALDPIAESEVYKKYKMLSSNKTSIFISHRLASTSFCDRIILLKDGKVFQEGTHEELVKIEGLYKEMFEVQRKLYIKEV